MSLPNGHRTVTIRGEEFKFSCAHFVSYKNFRERLHGHNYTVEVDVTGPMSDNDGYVIDFGILKAGIRGICKSLNERIIVPMNSPSMSISEVQRGQTRDTADISPCGTGEIGDPDSDSITQQIEIICLNSFFSFPKDDCAILPIKFSTAEEISNYFASQLAEKMKTDLHARKIRAVTVRIFERPTQCASYHLHL
jgi:dihydroneopterin triphosphate aldolase (PTPS-III) / 6-pyruvoyltetrahydropterin synthase